MTTCNADAKAKALKGADRKTFMKSCLSDKTAAATSGHDGQQPAEKMKTCNATRPPRAEGRGRKAFMKDCLSGSGGALTKSPRQGAPD